MKSLLDATALKATIENIKQGTKVKRLGFEGVYTVMYVVPSSTFGASVKLAETELIENIKYLRVIL